jgi:serine/threonine-protein kinase 24/25/MST4
MSDVGPPPTRGEQLSTNLFRGVMREPNPKELEVVHTARACAMWCQTELVKAAVGGTGTLSLADLPLDLMRLVLWHVSCPNDWEVAIRVVDEGDLDSDETEEVASCVEYLAQSLLDDPCENLARYIAPYSVAGDLWIVRELLDVSILDVLRSGTLDEQQIASVVHGVLCGLEFLHARYLRHFSLKAANVFINEAGDVKLSDWDAGLKNLLAAGRNRRQGSFEASPYWLAPEVIECNGHSGKVDVWSLGITFIEMATGFPPHFDTHPMRVIFLIPTRPPPVLEAAGFSETAKEFVASCLQKEPASRPSASELLAHPLFRSLPPNSGCLLELVDRHRRITLAHLEDSDGG